MTANEFEQAVLASKILLAVNLICEVLANKNFVDEEFRDKAFQANETLGRIYQDMRQDMREKIK